MKAFKRVGVAGTFAQIHIGHEKLIKISFLIGEQVIIALTSDDMTQKKKFREKIPDFDTRKVELNQYLHSLNIHDNYKIVKLEDKYGTAITDYEQDVIVVSEELYKWFFTLRSNYDLA